MKKQLLFILLLAASFNGYSQNEKNKINAIGISIPVIWNNSEATYYSGNKSNGKSTNYGINVNYSKTIYKGLFAVVGIGYFKQTFAIVRPFKYDTPLQPLFHTGKYVYENIQFYGGVGYLANLMKTYSIKGALTYNLFNSFKQKYLAREYQQWQTNHKSLLIGNMINLTFGIEKQISKRISVGIDFILPLSTHWNNDEIFFEYANYENTQQIAQNKSSVGTMGSCKYNF